MTAASSADVVLHARGCRVTGSGAGDLVEQQASRKASNSAARQESRTPAGRQPVDHHGPDRGTRSPQDLAELGAVGRLQGQFVAGDLALTAGVSHTWTSPARASPGQAPRTSRRRFRPGVIYATSTQILALQMSSNPCRCREKGEEGIMRAIIVGGGIVGLASALALSRRGWQVEVLERAAVHRSRRWPGLVA